MLFHPHCFFLVLVLVLLIPSQTLSQPCRVNERLVNGTCSTCPAGTYLDILDECSPCFTGAFRATPGATDPAQCVPCPANTFNNQEGATRCRPCPRGTTSLPFASACTRTCPPGQEFTSFGSTGCSPCSPGFFKRRPGLRDRCIRCPSGTFTRGSGASRCIACPPGTFQRNSAFDFNPISVFVTNGCVNCEAGTFSAERGSSSCQRCGPGMFSRRGSTSCTPCPRGQFNNLLVARSCRRCPSGTFTAARGAASCKDRLSGCPVTTFENNDGECSACMPGERLDVQTRTCVPCPEGQVSDGGVSEECMPCPSGKVPFGPAALFEKGGCACAPGTVDDGNGGCVPCPAGSFWENDQSFFQRVDNFRRSDEPDVVGKCSLCEQGTFTDEPGMLECKRCPENTFQNRFGQTSCMRCPPGFTSLVGRDEGRSKCVDQSLVCGRGEVRRPVRRCTTVTCCVATDTSCVPGRVREFSFCSTCRADEVPGRNNTCVPCPPSRRGEDGTRCIRCNENRGFRLNQLNSCSCGSGSGRRGRRCVMCRPGTTSRTLGNFDRVCAKCPPGTFTDRRGTNAFCEDCPPGTVAPNEGSMSCTPCPAGTSVGQDIFGRRLEVCRSA